MFYWEILCELFFLCTLLNHWKALVTVAFITNASSCVTHSTCSKLIARVFVFSSLFDRWPGGELCVLPTSATNAQSLWWMVLRMVAAARGRWWWYWLVLQHNCPPKCAKFVRNSLSTPITKYNTVPLGGPDPTYALLLLLSTPTLDNNLLIWSDGHILSSWLTHAATWPPCLLLQ